MKLNDVLITEVRRRFYTEPEYDEGGDTHWDEILTRDFQHFGDWLTEYKMDEDGVPQEAMTEMSGFIKEQELDDAYIPIWMAFDNPGAKAFQQKSYQAIRGLRTLKYDGNVSEYVQRLKQFTMGCVSEGSLMDSSDWKNDYAD